ncbi:MAG: hypothetical protein CMN34_08290 [Saprospirales bacterium]|nr:hypothetical protein [Saprospirales bacterium]
MSTRFKLLFRTVSFLSFVAMVATPCIGQFYINGTDVIVTDNGTMSVITDSVIVDNVGNFENDGLLYIQRDLVIESGVFDNREEADIDNTLINQDNLTADADPTTIFRVGQDWENNGAFTAGNSTVELKGGDQEIRGTSISAFYDLVCLGSFPDIKSLNSIDADVTNLLDLGNIEFATNTQNLNVTNPDFLAIQRTDGYVSSLDLGRLNRATNSTNSYLFPTGSSAGAIRYRPIEFTPDGNDNRVYGARLANVDATTEGFDVSLYDDILCAVNPSYYHRLYGSAPANLKMFYNPLDDGSWDAMAHWEGAPLWTDMGDPTEANGVPFVSLEVANWNNYADPAFALAIRQPLLEVGPDIYIEPGNFTNIPGAYSGQAPADIVWDPPFDLSCDDCFDPTATPLTTTFYTLAVTLNDYCAISDSLTIYVLDELVYLPTAFSPNGDGNNDGFRPIVVDDNIDFDSWEFSIYNRWGELVFKTNDVNEAWDGTYNGEKSPLSVYTWFTTYRYADQQEIKNQKGNVTLVR